MHHIFLVHGMGKYSDDTWEKQVINTLREQYNSFDESKYISFEQQFTFETIKYDGVFEKIRDNWKKQTKSIQDFLGTSGYELSSGASQLLKGLEVINKDEFYSTHVLDVLLYRYVPDIASFVRAEVNKQIISYLNKLSTDMPHWSIIAHSLGSAVVADSLHELYTTELDTSAKYPLYPKSLIMVANVSRVLQNDISVYESKVNPNIYSDGICQNYLSINHQYDPFVKPNPFKPWATWASDQSFIDLEINMVDEVNVHDINHYLRNPKVSSAIFNAILKKNSMLINADEVSDRYDDYVASIGKIQQEKFVSKIEEYAENSNLGKRLKTTLTPSILKVWSEFLSYVNKP